MGPFSTWKEDSGSQPESVAMAALRDSTSLLIFLCFLSLSLSSCLPGPLKKLTFMEHFHQEQDLSVCMPFLLLPGASQVAQW